MPEAPAELILATNNAGKVEELRAILAAHRVPLNLLTLADLSIPTVEPAETGRTLVENAHLKAISYARQTGGACLADDSGLEVDALDGRPGVISSHYGTDGVETGLPRAERDRLNNERVLRELRGLPPERRGARFVCVMALARPAGTGPASRDDGIVILYTARGAMDGRVADAPRGSSGFGYDPIFLVAPAFDRTAAELTPAEKNAISHRAAAARDMAARLKAGWTGPGVAGRGP